MAILQGDLGEYSVPDLLQFFQGSRKHGQLVVESRVAERSAGVFFEAGEVVHAYCPPDQGAPAIYQLLKWREGRFSFLKDARPEQRTVHDDLQNMLLEGLRRLDELRLVQDQLPPPETILHVERDSRKVEEIRLTQAEWRLLTLVDGRRTIAKLIEHSERPENEAARIVYSLLVGGLVSVDHDDGYLEAIVPERISAAEGSKRRIAPPTILANLLLKKIDGRRSLRQILAELGCPEQELVDELRLLVRSEWLRFAQGEDVYARFLAG